MQPPAFTFEEALCPFCGRVSVQRILTVYFYGTDLKSAWEGRRCFLCDRSTVWKNGKMVRPPAEVMGDLAS